MDDPVRRPRGFSLPSRDSARIRRDVDDELLAHVEMRAAALERDGVPGPEARALAFREFGDIEDAARYCADVDREAERRRRSARWWGDLRQDAWHALRLLRRAPTFAVATVLTLALAAGAGTAALGVVYGYLLRPLPFPHADRLMSISTSSRDERGARGPSLDDVEWTHADAVFDVAVRWDLDGFTLLGGRYAETVVGAWVTPGYFEALALRPALGRAFAAAEYREEAPVAMISHELWHRRFAGDPRVIGSAVTLHSTDRPGAASTVTIVGVTPREFWPIQWREGDLLRPLAPDPRSMPTLVRIGAGMRRAEAEHQLDAAVRAQLGGAIDSTWRLRLVPALEQHARRARPLILAVGGAVLFMFLAACGSVAGALVSRTAARRGELALRLAIGGGRARLTRQLLTESTVLGAIAAAFGLAIAWALLAGGGPLVERQLGTRVPGGVESLRPSVPLMALAFTATTLVGIVLGLVPTITFLASRRGAGLLATIGTGRGAAVRAGGAAVRKVLVAAQVAVATILLFGAGLMVRTVVGMAATDVGLRSERVLGASLLLADAGYPDSASRRLGVERLLARVARIDGVVSAAAAYPRPFQGPHRFPVRVEGSRLDVDASPRGAVFTVSPGYFATMDVPLRAGRSFDARDDGAAPLAVVISEGLARRLAPDGDVIGRRVRVRVPHLASFDDRDEEPWRTVVGVVGDTRQDFEAMPPGDVYVPYAQNPRALQSIVVRTAGDERAMVEPLRRAVAIVDPTLALSDIEPVAESREAHTGRRRGLAVLLGAFAAFALAVAALALYASVSYGVAQRRPELAVRMAVGASARSILALVLREGMATAIVGLGIGLAASVALGRVLRSQLYGVTPSDPVTLGSIAVLLLLAVAAACVVPGARAARTDVALVLRE